MSEPEGTRNLLAQLRSWGGPHELNALESMMWLAEADPRLRSTTTSVMILDRAPDWDRLSAGHEWTTRAVPRLRQRVMEPALGLGTPRWVDDPAFQLDYHLRRQRLPEPGTERQLLDMAQTLAMTPFDRQRPPWEATLVEGLEGGRAAYILKLHHATSDGIGIMQLVADTLNPTREGRALPPIKAHSSRRIPSRAELAARTLQSRLTALPEIAATARSTLSSLRGLLSSPDAAREALAYAASARRMIAPALAKGSPILRKRSLAWRFDVIEVALADFKAAAKRAEASLNDVYLAALIGGFRRYHEEMGVKITEMPIGFPISLRTEGDTAGGNKFVGAQYSAPVAERDPAKRIAHIRDFVRAVRAEPALDVVARLAPVMVRLPTAALTTIAANMTAAQDAQISNIPGIPRPIYMAGAEVTHWWPFAPVVGCAMMIAMVSHSGRCCIGINSDRAAVIEPELMTACLREGLDEILAFGLPLPPATAKTMESKPSKRAAKRAPGRAASASGPRRRKPRKGT
jgi:WS/DGAT/MGAT family acyltransferase